MATQIQATVSGALSDLKFEDVPGGAPGSPQEKKVTDKTVAFIKSLEGKKVSVDSEGKVTLPK